jgi:TonB family protein
MLRPLSLALAAGLTTLAFAQTGLAQTIGSSSSAIVLHRRFGSCELVQKGMLLAGDQYASVRLDGVSEPIYSPELGDGDFIGFRVDMQQDLAKLARKSGFRMKPASDALGQLPNVLRLAGASSCPSLEEALQSAERDRTERRQRLQSKLFQAGSGGVSSPIAVATPQPKAEVQSTSSSLQPAQAAAKAKVKFQGTAILSCVVAINGDVEQIKVIRSLSQDLDKKAVETVASWKFRPARKNGLPVPVETNVQIHFDLY